MNRITQHLNRIVTLLCIVPICHVLMGQGLSDDIRFNQLGFLPNSIKIAAVVNTEAPGFKVMNPDLSSMVYEGQFLPAAYYRSNE